MPFMLSLWLLICATPARAAVADAGLEYATDARLELLGVIQQLAGLRPTATPSIPADRLRLEKRFQPWRKHRAVTAYAAALKAQGSDPFAIVMLFHGPPPALAPRDPAWEIPFADRFADPEGLSQALQAFRDFAAASRFMDYYEEQSPARRRLESVARAEAIKLDTLKQTSAYMGYSLPIRQKILLSGAYVPGQANNFIIPYPNRSAASRNRPKDTPLEVYSILAPVSIADGTLHFEPAPERQEIIYAYVETDFLKLDVTDASTRYGSISDACKMKWSACAMDLIVRAVEARFNEVDHLDEGRLGRPGRPPEERFLPALNERLREYEAHRDRYPTLLSFYPRLFSVFSVEPKKL